MKIIVDKYEYAKIICACQKTLDCFGCTGKCALSDVCNGRDDLEDSCEINDTEGEFACD